MNEHRPYLMVWKNEKKNRWEHFWASGTDIVLFLKGACSPKRYDPTSEHPRDHIDSKWIDAYMPEFTLWKMELPGVYESLYEIFHSDELVAINYREGVAEMNDVLWEIEW